jgi:SnoaL-like polyketide cyclase
VTPDETKRTGLAAIECFNDPARRDEYFEILYDDDVVLYGYTPEPLTPKATVKGFYQVLFDAFPDCHVDTEAMYVERDVLTWRFQFSGTHTGTFQGIPPSGRSLIPGITILRFGAHRCVERWSVADFLGMMTQIGAISAM